jgi:hypothetical protein
MTLNPQPFPQPEFDRSYIYEAPAPPADDRPFIPYPESSGSPRSSRSHRRASTMYVPVPSDATFLRMQPTSVSSLSESE